MQGLTVAHIPNLDPEQWRIAHELGAVPGGTPYGLHKLAQYKLRVDFEAVHSAGRDPRKWAPAIVKKHLSRARIQHDGPHHHAAITWDERGAAGVYARHSGNYRRLGSGVIWATDQYDKRTNSYRLKALRNCPHCRNG
jgi:hypothetical protein